MLRIPFSRILYCLLCFTGPVSFFLAYSLVFADAVTKFLFFFFFSNIINLYRQWKLFLWVFLTPYFSYLNFNATGIISEHQRPPKLHRSPFDTFTVFNNQPKHNLYLDLFLLLWEIEKCDTKEFTVWLRGVVVTVMAFQRFSHPNYRSSWIYCSWQKGIKVQMELRLLLSWP